MQRERCLEHWTAPFGEKPFERQLSGCIKGFKTKANREKQLARMRKAQMKKAQMKKAQMKKAQMKKTQMKKSSNEKKLK